MLRYALLMSGLLLARAAAQGAGVGVDTLCRPLADFRSMPAFREYTAHQSSSYERNGGNGDSQHFLRMEGKDGVMADMDGPGAIVRLWSANANAAGHLKIFLDGAEKPVLDTPFEDLFNDKFPPFASPIARQSSGGFISYLPIPYAKHCKVVVE